MKRLVCFNSKLLMLILFVAAVVMSAGCSDDDNIRQQDLVMSWNKTYEELYENNDGTVTTVKDAVWTPNKYEIYTFNSNGTGSCRSKTTDGEEEDCELVYELKGKKLRIVKSSLENKVIEKEYDITLSNKKLEMVETRSSKNYSYVCRCVYSGFN